jgi:hypothetical protein
MLNKKIILILNIYNDANLLIKLLPKIYNEIGEKNFELLIADDSNNKSKTKIILKNFLYKNITLLQRNKITEYNERCLATRKAMEYIYINKSQNIEYIVEIDSDGAQKPKDIKTGHMIAQVQNLDLVIFSKYKKKSIVIGRTILRKIISWIITFVCKKFFNNKITDYSNSFRIYNKKSLKILLKKKIIFYGAIQHLQNLLDLLESKIKIKELPCLYKEMENRKSTISTKELLQSFKNFLYFIFINKFKIVRKSL